MSNITWIFPRTDFFEPINESSAVEDFYDHDQGRDPGAFRVVSLFMAMAMGICSLVFFLSYQQEQRNRKRVETIRDKRNAYTRIANMDLEQPDDDDGEPIPKEIAHHHRRTAVEPEKDISDIEISEAGSKDTELTIVISESELMISPQSLKTFVHTSNSSEGDKSANISELDMDAPIPRVYDYPSPPKDDVSPNKKPLDADLTLVDDPPKESPDQLADKLRKLEGFVYHPEEATPAKTTTYMPPTLDSSLLPLQEGRSVDKPDEPTEVIHQNQIQPASYETKEQPQIMLPKESRLQTKNRDPDGRIPEVRCDDDLSRLPDHSDVFQQDNLADEKSEESSELFDTGAVMEKFTEQPPMSNKEPSHEANGSEDNLIAESNETVEVAEPDATSTPEPDSDEHTKTTDEEPKEEQLDNKECESFETADELETNEQKELDVEKNIAFVSVASVEELPQQDPTATTTTTEGTFLTTIAPVRTPSKSTTPTETGSEDVFTNPMPVASGVKGMISFLENSTKKNSAPSPRVSGDKPWLRDFESRPSLKDSTKLLKSKLPALEDLPDKHSTNSENNEQAKTSETSIPLQQEDLMQDKHLTDREHKQDVTDTQTTTTITTSSVEDSYSAPRSNNYSDPPGFRYQSDADGMV